MSTEDPEDSLEVLEGDLSVAVSVTLPDGVHDVVNVGGSGTDVVVEVHDGLGGFLVGDQAVVVSVVEVEDLGGVAFDGGPWEGVVNQLVVLDSWVSMVVTYDFNLEFCDRVSVHF